MAAMPLLVGFGSQSGSAAGLAKRFAKAAETRGSQVTVRELNAVTPAELVAARRCVVITSTWGDGEPPDNAVSFWSALSGDSMPRLESLRFAVLGLGDRNYADSCGAARRIDERFEGLGAQRMVARGECDVDYENVAAAWIESLWEGLRDGTVTAQAVAAPPRVAKASPEVAPTGWSRQNPYSARLRVARPLNADGSSKDTRHVEILLGVSGLSHEVGDALGVVPSNCPALVEELLATLGCSGDEPVDVGGTVSLHEALLGRWVITQPTSSLLKIAAERSPDSMVAWLMEPSRKPGLDAWLYGRDVVDVFRAAPALKLEPAELATHLRPLQPRLYSIASSPKAHPGEVHITVGAVRFEAHGRQRKGVASCWLADRVVPGETSERVFVHVSRNFRPPVDPRLPMIMVGPGTGIAPFRAFLEERRATGATGPSWLFLATNVGQGISSTPMNWSRCTGMVS